MAMLTAFDIPALEDHAGQLARRLRISDGHWQEFMGYLERLKEHNAAMYAHSLRVGIYAYGLATTEKWPDRKFPFLGGCGHDYGKCMVSNQLLDAKNLSDRGYERIKAHSLSGFEGLKDKFLFTAFIAGLHHKYQHGGYGIDLAKDSPIPLSDEVIEKIRQTVQVVAIADFFDALVTRHNNKGLLKDLDDPAEKRAVMTEHFPDHPERVDWLLEHQIAA